MDTDTVLEIIENVKTEAKLLKMALGSCVSISWSTAELDMSQEKVDGVSAAGFETVELLILATPLLKEKTVCLCFTFLKQTNI